MKKIILITGGQRSGKSRYAQDRALSLSSTPAYLATSRIWDEEHRRRIERHQADRGPQWDNREEEKYLSRQLLRDRVVVIDCVTLWATNFFFDNDSDIDRSLEELKQEFRNFTDPEGIYIFVTNEIGFGGVSPNDLQRHFADLLGWLNQFISSKADEVVCLISGIPVPIK